MAAGPIDPGLDQRVQRGLGILRHVAQGGLRNSPECVGPDPSDLRSRSVRIRKRIEGLDGLVDLRLGEMGGCQLQQRSLSDPGGRLDVGQGRPEGTLRRLEVVP